MIVMSTNLFDIYLKKDGLLYNNIDAFLLEYYISIFIKL